MIERKLKIMYKILKHGMHDLITNDLIQISKMILNLNVCLMHYLRLMERKKEKSNQYLHSVHKGG